MSNPAPVRGSATNPRRAAKRAALQRAAEQRARARRQRAVLFSGLGALAVLGAVVLLVVVFGGGSGKKSTSSTGKAQGPAAVSEAPSPSPVPKVSLDPALSKKPVVNGSGAKPTKLVVDTLIEGQGPQVTSGQTLSVNYVGVSMTTGKEFDASWNRNQPFSFQVGTGGVIPGWDRGLVGARVGSRVQLDIPADLAYGTNPSGGQPGGPLRFVVDILSAQ